MRQVGREQRALERLGGARALLVQARVLDRDRRLRRDPLDHPLVLGREHPGLGVAEEQPARDLAVARDHRHREVAADRQVALRHAVVRLVVAVARVGEHVIEPDDALAVERGGEDRRVARHREPLERAPLDAGERVEHVGLAGVGDHVVEEGAERRGGQLAGGVGGELDDLLEFEPAGDRAADALQRLRALLLEQQPAAGLLGLDARGVLAVEQFERLDRVRRHLRQLGDDRLVVGRELTVLVPELEQAEAGAVARDERRDQPRALRGAVGPAAGDPVARADHVARRLGDDRRGRRRRWRPPSPRVRHRRASGAGRSSSRDRIGRVDPRARAGASPRIRRTTGFRARRHGIISGYERHRTQPGLPAHPQAARGARLPPRARHRDVRPDRRGRGSCSRSSPPSAWAGRSCR